MDSYGKYARFYDATRGASGHAPYLIRLHRQVIQEAAFDHARVMTALRRLFRKVGAYDGSGMRRPGKSSGRIFYVCRSAPQARARIRQAAS